MKLLIFILFLIAAGYYYLHYVQPDATLTSSTVPKDCILMSDGCNRCFAENGQLFGCTKLFCEITKTPECIKYKDK